MSVHALIQLTQGATITPAGMGMVGAVGVAVVCTSDNDTGVTAWTWTMESVPIGSAVPLGVIGNTPTVGFIPDVHGSYLISLHVQGNLSTDVSTDYRVFAIVNEMGWIIPAFHGRADAHNFGGQLRGWAGTATYDMLDSIFLYITDMLKNASEGDLLTYTGGMWGPAQPPISLTGTTTDNVTPVTLVQANHVWYFLPTPITYCSATFICIINGIANDGNACSAVITGNIWRGVAYASTGITNQVIDYIYRSDTDMTVQAVADVAGGGLKINVTGVDGVDVEWSARLLLTQSYFPVP